MRSMFGVLLIPEPYALIERTAWSSVKINRMFGLAVLFIAEACSTQLAVPIPRVLIPSIFILCKN